MGSDLKRKLAAALKTLIENRPVVDLGEQGGPSKSYIYRMIKEANPSIEALDSLLRHYGSNLGEFFAPWREEAQTRRLRQSAEAREHLNEIISSELDLDGVVSYLKLAASAARRRTNRQT